MVALYARLYLALTSSELLDATAPYEQTVVVSTSLVDYFYAFAWFRQHKLEHWLLTHNIKSAEYLALHSPAVEWLVKCFSDNSMVLKHLCECFGSRFYATAPSEMLELIRTASPSQFSTCHLYSLLAVQLSSASIIAERENGGKLQFLNESWSSITSQEDLEQYMECAAAFMKLIVAHFSDVVRHLNAATPDQLTAKAYNFLGALLENVVFGAKQHFEFFSKLIPSPGFLALMGMFKRESSVGVAKKVLQAFVGGNMKQKAGRSSSLRLHVVGPEAAVAHTLLVICCRVHDALDSLSTVSERSEATRDISAFISRLGYVSTTATSASARAQDEEQEALLMLYTDCRRAFYKLEPVKALLSRMVLRLAMAVHKRLGEGAASIIGGKKRDQARRHLIQSCLAFAHITIPSIEAGLEKLQLLISAANVALVASCIPQMDALVKAAIVQFAELDPAVMSSTTCSGDNESAVNETSRGIAALTAGAMSLSAGNEGVERVVRAIAQLMSILVYAPSLNDDDAFYFVTALRKAVLDRLVWLDSSGSSPRRQLEAGAARVRVLLLFAQLYALWSQKTLPNQLEGVDSNDALYGGDDAFFDEVQRRFSSTIEEVLREIEAMDGAIDNESEKPSSAVVWATQIELMLDFVNEVVPALEYDEFRATGSFKAEVSDAGKSGSRRRKNPRGGAALVRKCLAYTYDKVGHLKQAALKGGPASATSSGVKTSELVSWTCRYCEDTRVYVMAFLKELSKDSVGMGFDADRQHAIQALEEAVSNLRV
ncbi:hypothetical protein BBJ28_00015850 [Nothophytophthora sp. Chile5]|nr:hypothetical protein BBJ28_00015850 [Nothophytophthora sp. Chile5]